MFLFFSYYYGTVQNGPLGYSSNPSLSIPITGIIGDAQAATLTENCLSPCQAKLTLGTGIFLNLLSGSKALAVMNGTHNITLVLFLLIHYYHTVSS